MTDEALLAHIRAVLFHSDRGSQSASEDFTRLLDQHGITASMSRKGNY